jgi:chemotaxis protein histidine kinase CheA
MQTPPNKGTTFRVLLPLTPATENAPLNMEIR